MKNAKVVIAVVLMVFTAIVAMGYLTVHRSDSRKDVLFDPENVVNDIRIISSGHHSAGAMLQEAHYNNVIQWKRKAASAFELERSLYAAHVVGECRVNLHALLHLRTAVNHG